MNKINRNVTKQFINALKKEAIEFIVYVTKAGEQYDFTLLYGPLRLKKLKKDLTITSVSEF